jgi:hypothetical protein
VPRQSKLNGHTVADRGKAPEDLEAMQRHLLSLYEGVHPMSRFQALKYSYI